MRFQLEKLTKGHSTKAERKFAELLKKHHVPFRTKVMIAGREIDFLVGNYAIEIDAHEQDAYKNYMLISQGYNPIHYNSWEIDSPIVDKWIAQLKEIIWQVQA